MHGFRLSELNNDTLYHRRLELSTILVLCLITIVFYSFQKNDSAIGGQCSKLPVFKIDVLDIPQTTQLKRPPLPVKPSYPVEADDDEEMLSDVPVGKSLFDPGFNRNIPLPDFGDETEEVEFYKLEQRPKMVYRVQPVYPELAQKAHIEGMVTVQVLLSEKGKVLETRILKSIPMLDQAALSAAEKCIFAPGKQRDRFVRVRVSIPFVFKLTN